MLKLHGAMAKISVVITGTVLQNQNPDQMPGPISAVDSIFIGVSNELGSFESGLAASLFGPIVAVVAGGIGTILVVLIVARVWPEMGRLKTLSPDGPVYEAV
jgi:hypothetical protein